MSAHYAFGYLFFGAVLAINAAGRPRGWGEFIAFVGIMILWPAFMVYAWWPWRK